MKTIILLLWSLGVCRVQTTSSKVVVGSMDEHGTCHCSFAIPDMFPAERMEFLEASNLNLSLRFQKEIEKIQNYQQRLDSYLENIRNLTLKVETCDKDVSYNQLDFDMLKVEINEMEALVMELKTSLNGSNEKVEALYIELQNISVLVNQLERHDKNNILKVRREISSLQKRLNECKLSHQSPLRTQFVTCEHGRILNVSKPQVVQVNWRGTSFKTGGWGKDSFFGSTQELYWVLSSDNSYYITNVRLYQTYKDLKQYKNFKDQSTPTSGRGSGLTLYNNSIFYNCNTRDICKLNLDTNKVERKTLPNLGTRFSYAGSLNQDVDFEGDEYGLWVLYSKEDVLGNMVIGLLNTTSLDLIETWTTSVYKPSVTNAFMVCGIMYATRTINTREEEIFYSYDTNTSEEHHLKIPFDKTLDNIHSLSYNANDRLLYMYNDGFEVNYSVHFTPLAEGMS
ncbi:olfactomedin-4-like [Ranitomeya variabilis]|uniref:olfactomedin-4-like n=1 Tax=Ranitomeya variabilis TaxID=490064 RepID=UPI0040577A87